MYIYQIEFFERYEKNNSFEIVQSEFEYSKDEFEKIIKNLKDEVIKNKGYFDWSDWGKILDANGFKSFDFTATAYINPKHNK
jgi:hypothetical protein